MLAGGSMKSIREFQMKKVNYKKSSMQIDIPAFSIQHYSKNKDASRLTRVVNTKPWAGRDFERSGIPGTSLPHIVLT